MNGASLGPLVRRIEVALQKARERAMSAKFGAVAAMVKIGARGEAMARECINALDEAADEEAEINSILGDFENLRDQIRGLQKNLDLNYRARLHWRILATRACLGLADSELLKAVCVHELMGSIPTEVELEKQLHEVAALLEQRDAAADQFGPLRVIQLDKEFPCASPTPAAPTASSSPPGP